MVTHFLYSIHDQNLIEFNPQKQSWQWEINRIKQNDCTENVVDLMTKKIFNLPEQTQDILKFASCIGNRFELNTLSIVCEAPSIITGRKLWPAIEAGLILPISKTGKRIQDFWKFWQQDDSPDQESDLNIVDSSKINQLTFKFLHDRVQQAAYSIIGFH